MTSDNLMLALRASIALTILAPGVAIVSGEAATAWATSGLAISGLLLMTLGLRWARRASAQH